MISRLTVGIPFHNNAATIQSAVRSVLVQSFEEWNLILVDDGSTDGSLDLVRNINEPRIKVVSDGLNVGLAARLNQLADLAESPLLARMDADDIMHPDRLAREVEAIDSHPAGALVFSDAVSIDAQDRPTGYRQSHNAPSVSQHFRSSPYIHPTLLASTEWFRSNRYDSTYRRCQDQELWVRTHGKQQVVSLAAPLLYLRESGTVSAAKYATSMAGTRRVLRQHGDEMLGRVGTGLRVGETFAKQGAYSVAEIFGLSDRLVRLRAESLSSEDQIRHAEVVSRILSTPLPGVDSDFHCP